MSCSPKSPSIKLPLLKPLQPLLSKEMKYFVMLDTDWYGNVTRVVSAHETLEAAQRNAPYHSHLCVRVGNRHAGTRFLREDEKIYPVIPRTLKEQSANPELEITKDER